MITMHTGPFVVKAIDPGRVDKSLEPRSTPARLRGSLARWNDLVVAYVYAALLFEHGDHGFDAVAILVSTTVGMFGRLADRARWNDWQDATYQRVLTRPFMI